MASPSNVIHTVMRLADNNIVPIVLRETKDGWLKAVLINAEQIKRCRAGHIKIKATTHTQKDGYQRCTVCRRLSNARYRKTHLIEQARYDKRRYLSGRSAA